MRADGVDVLDSVAGRLDRLSELCRRLGVSDPVEEYFAPVVGRWSDLHAEAERWRAVGRSAGEVAHRLTAPLGGLDAAWEGADADGFVGYMGAVGLAGQDLGDAMGAMAEVLDTTADALRQIVTDLADVLADAADTAGGSGPVAPGDDRARAYLDHLRRPTGELFEAVRQVLEALVALCDGIDGSAAFEPVTMPHSFPERNWVFDQAAPPPRLSTGPVEAIKPAEPAKPAEPVPAEKPELVRSGGSTGGAGGGAGAHAPAPRPPSPGGLVGAGEAGPTPSLGSQPLAAAAVGGVAAGVAGGAAGGMVGGMPMMGGMGAGQQGDTEHKSKVRPTVDPSEILGDPITTSDAVIGED